MSKPIAARAPAARATRAAPTTPPAGPESSARGPRKRAPSVSPPDDCMKRSARARQRRARARATWRCSSGVRYASAIAVSPRASSPSSRATSCERDDVREAGLARERRERALVARDARARGSDATATARALRARGGERARAARRRRAPRAARRPRRRARRPRSRARAAAAASRCAARRDPGAPGCRSSKHVARARGSRRAASRAPRRSSSALVATVVPSAHAARRERARPARRPRAREQRADRRRPAPSSRESSFAACSAPSGASADHVGEGAAAVDPELPSAPAHRALRRAAAAPRRAREPRASATPSASVAARYSAPKAPSTAIATTTGCTRRRSARTAERDAGAARARPPRAARAGRPRRARPMRRSSARRSSANSTQPAMPLASARPAAPQRGIETERPRQRRTRAAIAERDDRPRAARTRSAAACACRAARSRSPRRAARAWWRAADGGRREDAPDVARRRPRRSGRSGRAPRVTTSPSATNAIADGTMKYAMRRIAASSRARSAAAIVALVAERAREHRQLGRRDRHAEEAHRQRVEDLRVAERRDRAERQQAREQLVDVRADLQHAAAHEGRA